MKDVAKAIFWTILTVGIGIWFVYQSWAWFFEYKSPQIDVQPVTIQSKATHLQDFYPMTDRQFIQPAKQIQQTSVTQESVPTRYIQPDTESTEFVDSCTPAEWEAIYRERTELEYLISLKPELATSNVVSTRLAELQNACQE